MSEPQPDPARPGRPRSSEAVRAGIVVVLAGALILGGLIDRTRGHSPVSNSASVSPAPVAAPARALSSSWFCAGATDSHAGSGNYSGSADHPGSARHSGSGRHGGSGNHAGPSRPGGPAPGAVVIANSGSVPAPGVVSLVPSTGPTVQVPVTVPAQGSQVIAEDVPGGAPWIGAIVDIDAGGVAVEQEVNGPLGASSTPCATAGSSEWYFAAGATLVNTQTELTLLNPYPTAAIVDLAFTTNQGVESPEQFQGLTVPSDGLVAVNLGDHLRRRQFIATSVTARSGRLVAWKTQVVTPPSSGEVLLGTPAASSPLADPANPIPGVTVTLGAPDTGTTWTWAEGIAGNGVNESYVIYNPGDGTAQLKLSVELDQGVAEPFDLSVGPDQVTTVMSSQEVRIPPGVGHAAVLQSVNGVPVMAERVVSAASPSVWSGNGELPGGQVAASRWLLAAAQADPTHDGWVVIYNPGSSAVEASLSGPGPGDQAALETVTVPSGRQASIHLNQLRRQLNEPLVLTATGLVYTELDTYGAGGAPGVSLSFGVPLSGPDANGISSS